jgi:hypothetical protein
MADSFNVTVEDEAFLRALSRFTLMISDLRPFWPLVVPLFIGWMREQFETEGEFAGQHWAALSESYAEQKARKYPGKGILVAEGDLRQAASRPKRLATGSTLELTVDWAGQKGKEVDLGWLQEGTARMPARPLLFGEPLPARARFELDAVAGRYVQEAIGRSGLGGFRSRL